MPIQLVAPKPVVAAALRDHLGDMAARQQFRTTLLSAHAPDTLSLAVPHPVFTLNVSDIGTADGFLERARMTGWRYLVTSGNAVLAGVEADASHHDAEAVFSHTNESEQVQSFSRELANIEDSPALRRRRFTLGLLRVPPLYLSAMWLRDAAANGVHDLYVPLSPAPSLLKAGQPLNTTHFTQALRELATRWAAQPSTSTSN
ncbi:MAG: hypothetical protein QM674_20505 [Burkholderiaceae bacterium]